MDLLERGTVLRSLAAHLDAAAHGRGSLVLLRGEAGIGKTAVVRRFAEQTGTRARVLVGACDPLSTPRPLGPLADVAGDLGTAVTQALDAALAGSGGAVGVFETLLAELRSAKATMVLVFEDLHWADAASLDLLRFLARRIENLPVLLIGTYRDDQIGPDHPLAVVLGDLAGCPATDRCSIEPLSRQAVGILAAGRDVDAEELYRVTGGNPFFVTEVLAAGVGDIPTSVRDAVLGRLAQLSSTTREVVEAVAVIGSPADLSLVRSVAQMPDRAVEEVLSSGILHASGQSMSFRHELARKAVLAAIGDYRRVRLHRLVLAAMRSRSTGPGDLPRLAYHADEAGDPAAVLEYAPQAAADASALGAHREAAAQYERALRNAATSEARVRAELAEGHAYACYLTGMIPSALRSWEDAGRARESIGDRLREGDDLRWASYMLWLLSRNQQAAEAGRRAVVLLDGGRPSLELARAHVNVAEQSSFECDLASTTASANRAIELGEALNDPGVVLRGRFHTAVAQVLCRDDGWDELEQVWRLAVDGAMVEHAGMFGPVMSSVAMVHRHFERARRYDDAAVAFFRDYDLDMFLGFLRGARALRLVHQGQWDAGADEAAAVLSVGSLPPVSRVQPLTALALVRARRGDPEVWPLLDEARDSGEQTDLIRLGPALEARAEAAWLAGDDTAAIAEASDALAAVTPHTDPWAVGGVARWIPLAGGEPTVPMAVAGPYQAELQGDWAAAATAWQELGCPYDEALALLAGDSAAVGQALAMFDSLDARPAAARARARLRRLGVRYGVRGPRPTTRANRFGLTAREQEVLVLLREQLSSAEIAARLYITPKTAGHHIAAILTKLGVHSRAEAMQLLDDHKL